MKTIINPNAANITTTVYFVEVNENTTVQLITDYPNEELSDDNFSLRTTDYSELSNQGYDDLKAKIISRDFYQKEIEIDLHQFGYRPDDTLFLIENYGIEV